MENKRTEKSGKILIPRLLREFRLSSNLSQKKMAERYGISFWTYKGWESITRHKGCPNLISHFTLLSDFFTWLPMRVMETTKEGKQRMRVTRCL